MNTTKERRQRRLKTNLEILDAARVVDYETIKCPGFSVLQLRRCIEDMKQTAARDWFAEVQKNETQGVL